MVYFAAPRGGDILGIEDREWTALNVTTTMSARTYIKNTLGKLSDDRFKSKDGKVDDNHFRAQWQPGWDRHLNSDRHDDYYQLPHPTPELKYINYSCRPLYLYAYTISDIIDAS